jgi:hypothetical protein
VPTASIDTFFACSLIVSVAIVATVFAAGNMQTQIDAMRDVNKQDYLQTVADNIVFSYGNPRDWGSTGQVPQCFGLSDYNSQQPFALDIDKISRLSSQNGYVLSYPQIVKASRLGVAFGISVFQVLSIHIELSGSETVGESTSYSFVVRVDKDTKTIASNLHFYVTAPGYLEDATIATSDGGIANISFQIPNSAKGTALLIVFARATIDARMVSVQVYSFGHLSGEPQPNQTFLELSPLNYSLALTSNSQEITITSSLAFSFSYESNLTATSNSTFEIPRLVEKSPVLLMFQGLNGTSSFTEWTTYPQLPYETGADFSNSETNVFEYTVIIEETYYNLRLSFGDLNQ